MARAANKDETKTTAPGEEVQGAREGDTPKKPNPTVSADNGLNIRVGPHKSYPAVAVLENNTELEILPLPGGVKVPGWYLVTTTEHTGWVAADFIRIPEET